MVYQKKPKEDIEVGQHYLKSPLGYIIKEFTCCYIWPFQDGARFSSFCTRKLKTTLTLESTIYPVYIFRDFVLLYYFRPFIGGLALGG